MQGRWQLFGLCVVLAACGGEPPTTQQTANAPSEMYTPEVAAHLDPHGTFQNLATAPAGELTGAQASALALAYVKQFRFTADTVWSVQRGAPIRYEALRACGRPLYAVSAYQPLPADVIRPIRGAFGPQWIITLCDGAQRNMVVGVAALATDLRLVGDQIVFPPWNGEEFTAMGIQPSRTVHEEYRGPEDAAAIAFATTGVRLRSVPVLVAARISVGSALRASWRIELEQATTLRGARRGTRGSRNVVYVGIVGGIDAAAKGQVSEAEGLMVPDEQQSPTEPYPAILTRDWGTDAPSTNARIERDTTYSLVFQQASQE